MNLLPIAIMYFLFFTKKHIKNTKPMKKKTAPRIEINSISDFVGLNSYIIIIIINVQSD